MAESRDLIYLTGINQEPKHLQPKNKIEQLMEPHRIPNYESGKLVVAVELLPGNLETSNC